MIKKLKIEKQFLLISVVILATIGLVFNFILDQSVKTAFLDERKNFLAEHINEHAATHLKPEVYNAPYLADSQMHLKEFYNDLAITGIASIKIFGLNKEIIFSDDSALIGQKSASSPGLDQALAGQIVDEYKSTSDQKKDNVISRNSSDLIEIFMPVKYNSTQIGVVAIYYDAKEINSKISKFQLIITFFSFFSLSILYLSLYWLFKKTSKKLDSYNARDRENSKRILELKDEFLYLATHELRAPATAINGYLEIIKDTDKKIKLSSRGYLNKIKEINGHLLALINDILEIARTETDKIKIQLSPENLVEVTKKTIDVLLPLANEKQISITYKPGPNLPEALINSQKTEEVLTNLISNAIKYNKLKGEIQINHELKDNSIITRISDTGIGLSKEDKTHLFEKFWRSSNEAATAQIGTGLGLFIVKQLIERMQGKIWVESTLGQGTTFSFSLPIAY